MSEWSRPVTSRPSCLKKCRVLVIEDEYLLGADLELALRAVGADVVGPMTNLADALDQADKGGFDVAILDINLGDSNAYGIAARLQQQAVPFLFTTGYGSAFQISSENWSDGKSRTTWRRSCKMSCGFGT